MIVAQLLLVVIFFTVTVLKSYTLHVQPLKGSTLATMCALHSETRAALGGIDKPDEINRRAEVLKVKLDRGGRVNGPALWLGCDNESRTSISTVV